MRNDLSRVSRFLLAYASVSMAFMAFRYVTGDPRQYHELFRDKYISELGVVWLHGVPATLSLALGPIGFWVRKRWLAAHRVLGMTYLLCVLLASMTGFLMGLVAYGGRSSQLGFCLMSVLWFASACQAWREIRRGNIAAHRVWMIRNFTLTFGAFLLRAYLLAFQRAGLAYHEVYPIVTWLAWAPNLLGLEVYLWWIRHGAQRKAPENPRGLLVTLAPPTN